MLKLKSPKGGPSRYTKEQPLTMLGGAVAVVWAGGHCLWLEGLLLCLWLAAASHQDSFSVKGGEEPSLMLGVVGCLPRDPLRVDTCARNWRLNKCYLFCFSNGEIWILKGFWEERCCVVIT